jgi:hypothetical protein
MTLLPSVRDQLEDAATRRAWPAGGRRRSTSPRLGVAAPRVQLASIALALLLALAALAGVSLAGTLSGGSTRDTQTSASQPLMGVGTLTPAAPSGAREAAYLQLGTASSGAPVSVPVRAYPVRAPRGGYEIAVSFTPRVRVVARRVEYSLLVHGPAGRALRTIDLASAGGGHAGAVTQLVGAPDGGRLAPGAYTGVVGLVYATTPALLEGSETVYLPVGAFHVRVP